MSRIPTNNDIFQALVDLKGDVGEIKGTMRAVHGKIDTQTVRLNSHSERLGKVERKQSWWMGAAAAAGTLIGGAITIVAKKFGWS